MSFSNSLIAVRPTKFTANLQTMEDNAFQSIEGLTEEEIVARASAEFDRFVQTIRAANINVRVFDQDHPDAPDSVFPDWLSTHRNHLFPGGILILYPMHYPNRRLERSSIIINHLRPFFKHIIDLTYLENEGAYLEGKGSLIFDHRNRRFFCALSGRSHQRVLDELIRRWNAVSLEPYHAVTFTARDPDGQIIYHTDCMLTIAHDHIVLCSAAIEGSEVRSRVQMDILQCRYPYRILDLSFREIRSMCANMQSVYDNDGNRSIIMSQRSYSNMSPSTLQQLSAYKFVVCDVDTIEFCGGGSTRCMLAEDYSEVPVWKVRELPPDSMMTIVQSAFVDWWQNEQMGVKNGDSNNSSTAFCHFMSRFLDLLPGDLVPGSLETYAGQAFKLGVLDSPLTSENLARVMVGQAPSDLSETDKFAHSGSDAHPPSSEDDDDPNSPIKVKPKKNAAGLKGRKKPLSLASFPEEDDEAIAMVSVGRSSAPATPHDVGTAAAAAAASPVCSTAAAAAADANECTHETPHPQQQQQRERHDSASSGDGDQQQQQQHRHHQHHHSGSGHVGDNTATSDNNSEDNNSSRQPRRRGSEKPHSQTNTSDSSDTATTERRKGHRRRFKRRPLKEPTHVGDGAGDSESDDDPGPSRRASRHPDRASASSRTSSNSSRDPRQAVEKEWNGVAKHIYDTRFLDFEEGEMKKGLLCMEHMDRTCDRLEQVVRETRAAIAEAHKAQSQPPPLVVFLDEGGMSTASSAGYRRVATEILSLSGPCYLWLQCCPNMGSVMQPEERAEFFQSFEQTSVVVNCVGRSTVSVWTLYRRQIPEQLTEAHTYRPHYASFVDAKASGYNGCGTPLRAYAYMLDIVLPTRADERPTVLEFPCSSAGALVTSLRMGCTAAGWTLTTESITDASTIVNTACQRVTHRLSAPADLPPTAFFTTVGLHPASYRPGLRT